MVRIEPVSAYPPAVLPAAVLSRGAEILRRRARRPGPLREALEREQSTFVPAPGMESFGPL